MIRTLVALLVCVVVVDAQKRVTCVGNSITFGAGTSNPSQLSYPSQLQNLLGSGFEVFNFGVSGATLLRTGDRPYWNESAFQDALNSTPDIVIIMLGTNDSKRQNFETSGPEAFERDANDLVRLFQNLPSLPIVIVNFPIPAFPNSFGIQGDVLREKITPILESVANAVVTPTIDTYPGMLPFEDELPDGVHPNDDGAGRLAKIVSEGLSEILDDH